MGGGGIGGSTQRPGGAGQNGAVIIIYAIANTRGLKKYSFVSKFIKRIKLLVLSYGRLLEW